MNNYSTEQLQKIVDDAPDGAEYIQTDSVQEDMYLRFQEDRLDFFGKVSKCWFDTGYRSLESAYEKGVRKAIKLSEIQTELESRPKFKVGDRVVFCVEFNPCGSEIYTVYEFTELGKIYIGKCSTGQKLGFTDSEIRKATPEEEAAGHRIDEPAKMMTRESLLPPLNTKPIEFSDPLPDLKVGSDGYFHTQAQPDTITTKLDPAKCRVVDPAVYDAPTDSPRDDFDAMSESHRSPACKCHELPFDAELVVPAQPDDPLMLAYKEIANSMRHYYENGKASSNKHTQGMADGLQDALLILESHFEHLKGDEAK